MTLYAYALPHRAFRRGLSYAGHGAAQRYLRLNVRDEGEAFVLSAPVPGFKAEDLKIQVLDDVLTVEGVYPEDKAEYLLREIPSGPFRREIRLTSPLDAEHIEARIADGILTLRLPKAETSRPRTIKVAAK